MDGSFLDLNGETMETEVDDFFREIYKMLKFFQQKYKKAEQEREKVVGGKKQTGEANESEQDQPITLLCSSVIEQIKEFKVHLKYISVLLSLWDMYNNCINISSMRFFNTS